MSGDQFIEKLAGIAADANIVRAVHALPGGSTFAQYVQRETANYWAARDDDDNSGLLKWMQDRWGGAQAAWADDVATVMAGDAAERGDRVASPSSSAILEAGEAWRRGEANDEHTRVLFDAVTRMHGQFMQRVEREMASLRPGEDPNERIAPHRDAMRELFRRDVEALVRHARSGP